MDFPWFPSGTAHQETHIRDEGHVRPTALQEPHEVTISQHSTPPDPCHPKHPPQRNTLVSKNTQTTDKNTLRKRAFNSLAVTEYHGTLKSTASHWMFETTCYPTSNISADTINALPKKSKLHLHVHEEGRSSLHKKWEDELWEPPATLIGIWHDPICVPEIPTSVGDMLQWFLHWSLFVVSILLCFSPFQKLDLGWSWVFPPVSFLFSDVVLVIFCDTGRCFSWTGTAEWSTLEWGDFEEDEEIMGIDGIPLQSPCTSNTRSRR